MKYMEFKWNIAFSTNRESQCLVQIIAWDALFSNMCDSLIENSVVVYELSNFSFGVLFVI